MSGTIEEIKDGMNRIASIIKDPQSNINYVTLHELKWAYNKIADGLEKLVAERDSIAAQLKTLRKKKC